MRWLLNKPENELQPIKKKTDTTTALRRPSSGVLPEGVKSPMKECWVHGEREEKHDRREASK